MFGVYLRETILRQLHFPFQWGGQGVEYSYLWSLKVWRDWERLNFVYPESRFNAKVPRQTSAPYHAKNVRPVFEEQPSRAGRGSKSHSCWELSCGESPNTKPSHCPKHSSLKIRVFYQICLLFCLIFFISAGARDHQLSWLTVSYSRIRLWYSCL